ncbi:MAG: sialidase family protein [Tepidisphaeraceae bacterium]
MPKPPGAVVFYSPPVSRIFVGSPGIAVLHDGSYLMKCDEFGPGSSDQTAAVTPVFRSTDCGASWKPIARISGLYWANIFEHKNAVYMIGVHHEYGPLVVVKSTDGGTTWTTPRDAKTGLIRPGRWHTAPVPVIEHDGRLWRAVEDAQGPGGWGVMFHPHLMSIPVDADLLDADQWTISTPVPRDGAWLGGKFGVVLEGNAVLDHETNKVLDILRTDHPQLAAVATVSADGKTLSVAPAFDQMPFQGVDKKFEIRWDEKSRQYFALANPIAPADITVGDTGGVRNTLALFSSPDLRQWTMKCVLLHHPDWKQHAFQYPDWAIDGADLLVASRTGFDSPGGPPPRQHDANYLTFHRFHNFRDLTMKDGVQLPQPPEVREDVGSLRIRGVGFSVGKLRDGLKTFSNRNYVFADVPAKLDGAAITQGAGDFRGWITVKALAKPATLFVFTAGPREGLDLSLFTEVPALGFHYTDGGRSRVSVFKRELSAGETVTLPEGNWAGVHVLVPPAKSEPRS